MKTKKEYDREYYLKHTDRIRENRKKIQKQFLKENPQKYYRNLSLRVKKWRSENPEKLKAHRKVFVALRAGRIQKQNCFCGKKGEAHHEDYSKPLEIIWLCKLHHREKDRLRSI